MIKTKLNKFITTNPALQILDKGAEDNYNYGNIRKINITRWVGK
jgi:hypothetical protein